MSCYCPTCMYNRRYNIKEDENPLMKYDTSGLVVTG